MYVHLLKIALIIFCASGISYSQDKIELKNANELSGKVVDGQNVREANGNVEFVQGNVKVFCNSATQFIEANRVELRGNVRLFQDTLSLFTSNATYFGSDKKAICEGGVTLKDPNATIRADKGVYSFTESKAVFTGDVIIVNPDYRITSSELTYLRNTEDSYAKGNVIVTTDSAVIRADNIDFFKNQNKSFAYGNVSLESDSTIITSDSATNYSNEKKSIASGNVKIVSQNNNTIIYGDKIENYEKENYTILKDNAKLMQIENETDTFFIFSHVMEAFRGTPEIYVAKDSVEIIRNYFLAKCETGIYFKDTESISLSGSPIVWQDNLQMTGDSIYAELPGKKLQTIYVRKSDSIPESKFSFVISTNRDEYFKSRYDQISGEDITIEFINDKINQIKVEQNSNSIYFAYEDDKANGMNKIEGEIIFIYFDAEEKIEKIKVDMNPVGEYIPESLLNTADATLPGFELRDDKPTRR